ncbi:hypothetical protein [Mucilaginibacter sp.]
MSLVQGDKVFDKHMVDEVISLMQQMVSRYMRFNVTCHKLRFYAPDYFAEQLMFHYHDHAPKGLKLTESGLTAWGAEVHTGYENKVILFCPHHVPSQHSPVIEISRFGSGNMVITHRE